MIIFVKITLVTMSNSHDNDEKRGKKTKVRIVSMMGGEITSRSKLVILLNIGKKKR